MLTCSLLQHNSDSSSVTGTMNRLAVYSNLTQYTYGLSTDVLTEKSLRPQVPTPPSLSGHCQIITFPHLGLTMEMIYYEQSELDNEFNFLWISWLHPLSKCQLAGSSVKGGTK